MKIDKLLQPNKLYSFYGVDSQLFKLGSIVFEALENPDDGYRSYLESCTITKNTGTFFNQPLANVYYKNTYSETDIEGFDLIDESGHVWLTVGTDYNDYYPYFVFCYEPKKDQKTFANPIPDDFDPLLMHSEI